MNKVLLHGNLTSDPELKQSQTGRAVTTFALATNRDWKNKKGEKVTETDFHRVVAFGKLGEIVGKHLKKGSPVLVAGRLSNHSYINKEGQKRYMQEVVIEDFNFLSRRSEAKKEEMLVAA